MNTPKSPYDFSIVCGTCGNEESPTVVVQAIYDAVYGEIRLEFYCAMCGNSEVIYLNNTEDE